MRFETDSELPRAGRVIPRAERGLREIADVVTLDYDGRRRRRLRLVGDGGTAFLLDLPDVVTLRDGDALLLDDGRFIAVRAAAERVVEIACATPSELARIAWHLGNRHWPTQILEGSLRIREDPVLVEMLRGLGASTFILDAAFEPEGGAYAHGAVAEPTHGHDHGHAHD